MWLAARAVRVAEDQRRQEQEAWTGKRACHPASPHSETRFDTFLGRLTRLLASFRPFCWHFRLLWTQFSLQYGRCHTGEQLRAQQQATSEILNIDITRFR